MFRLSASKLMMGGLGLMLCAKAAVSFPIIPLSPDAPPKASADQDLLVLTAEEEKKTAGLIPDIAPPLVENLHSGTEMCEAPEVVLQSLARERDLVADQRDQLREEEAAIALVRAKFEMEEASLLELKGSIEALLAKVEAAQTEDLNRLIEFYKTMKPAEAARIMDDLDIETTIMVLGTMSPRNVAPIMAKMAPVRARAVSKIILERSQLPGDQDLVGIRLN